MDEIQAEKTFEGVVKFLTVEPRRSMSERIGEESGLSAKEIAIIVQAAETALLDTAERRLNRVLLMELHAAKLSGQLLGSDEVEKFEQFLKLAMTSEFIEKLKQRYPALHPRLNCALDQQVGAIVELARHIALDRDRLSAFAGQELGVLQSLSLGEGDVHDRGKTVAKVEFVGGTLMYKPRSLRIDAALAEFLDTIFPDQQDHIQVPAVLDLGDYGWTRFVDHVYCSDDEQLATFYRNIGHWLAVMRLLGGTDIHHENLIASGSIPFVVDVESLFVTDAAGVPSDNGEAVDLAEALIRSSVLRTGLVPFRAPVLGFSGVDISAIGALRGEQPKMRIPEIINHGTTEARVGLVHIDLDVAKNHPCENPDISKFWENIVYGFRDLTEHLFTLQKNGQLRSLLSQFRGCRIRIIRRPTQSYVEIMRMLWHPASLHDEPAAIERARDLLTRNAAASPIAPAEPEIIRSEIEDMRFGDVPIFARVLDQSKIDEVFQSWLGMRSELEELTIRGALVTAHLNTRLNDDKRSPYDLSATHPHAKNIDQRRRSMAKETIQQLLDLSVRGRDGTVTWISPILGRSGWTMRTLQPNLYVGLSGIALALAGYSEEMRMGRADEISGVSSALEGVLTVLKKAEDAAEPEAMGGFIGLGSQILTWLILSGLRPESGLLENAVKQASILEKWNVEGAGAFDILEGVSGAIVPLIQLADATQDGRWLEVAARAGRRLEMAAIVDERGARWPASIFNEPIGGFAHGSTGIGWALTRLGLSQSGTPADRERWLVLADRGFDFEESLYDADFQNWIDVRKPEGRDFANTWCHGSVGIGLAACDLYSKTGKARHLSTLRRAVRAAIKGGWGYSHTLCHGDLSSWELLMRASKIDPALVQTNGLPGIAIILSSIEEHGIVGGLARDAFTPGLMSGISGSIHQLNRMHPDCLIPSPLLMECKMGEYERNKDFECESMTG